MLDRVLMFMGGDEYVPPEYNPTILGQLFSAGNGTSCSFSPNDSILATTHDVSPYLQLFEFSNGSTTLIPNTNYSQPTGVSWDVSFSPDGLHMAVAHGSSPFSTVYKINGTSFTKLPNLSPTPGALAISCQYSPDGMYLAVATQGTIGISVYKRSGDSYARLNTVDVMPGGSGFTVAFSPDSTYMAVAQTSAPYLTIYKREGDQFSVLPTTPQQLQKNNGVTFSPDGKYLVISGDSTITAYNRIGDNFEEVQLFDQYPNSTCVRSTFSPDGYFFVTTSIATPFIHMYKKVDNIFVKQPTPSTIPSDDGREASFTADGKYMVLSSYKTSGNPSNLIYENF